MGVLGMKLNSILWCPVANGALWPFIGITSRSILNRSMSAGLGPIYGSNKLIYIQKDRSKKNSTKKVDINV